MAKTVFRKLAWHILSESHSANYRMCFSGFDVGRGVITFHIAVLQHQVSILRVAGFPACIISGRVVMAEKVKYRSLCSDLVPHILSALYCWWWKKLEVGRNVYTYYAILLYYI